MLPIDYILLGAVGVFVWLGFWAGFIKALGRVLGLFIGIALASHYYTLLAPAWEWVFFNNRTLTEIALFILIFLLVSKLVGLLFWLADKVFGLAKFLPFLGSLNRILGGLLGLLEGIIIIGVILLVLTQYPISDQLIENINQSWVADILLDMMIVVKPFVPDSFTTLPFTSIFK